MPAESGVATPVESLQINSCGMTDVGLKRTHNEDNFACADDVGLYVVADGMGGHAAGEVASSAAINTIFDFVRQFRDSMDVTWPFDLSPNHNRVENALLAAIRLANNSVCNLASQNQAYSGMGTTIASVMLLDSSAILGHVGDSRIYRMRNGSLELMTLDHSWVNEQLQRHIITEEEAKSHRWRNVITRALGNNPDLEVELKTVDLEPGDLLLLCSDGLSGMVSEAELRRIVTEQRRNPEEACNALISQANANGGIDNITVVLVDVKKVG